MARTNGFASCPGSQLVVTSFACEQRPRTSPAPAYKRTAIFALSISIVVVAAPARAEWSIHFQHGVHDLEGIHNDRIVGLADSVTHQFQKTRIHDFFGRKYVPRAGLAVRNGDVSLVRIFVRIRIVRPLRKNPDVMPGHAGEQSPFRCDRPALDMTFQEIGVFFQVFRGRLIASFASKACGADQSGNIGRQRGGGIAADLLPALLRSHGAMADEISSRPHDHGVRVEVPQGVLTFEPPGEQNGESDFIQLDSPPVGLTVNPEVLGETSALLLRDIQIDQRSYGCGAIAGGQHRIRAVDHVARPYQVVTTLIFIADGFSPWNGERGDKSARIRLVFVSAEQIEARAVQVTSIA